MASYINMSLEDIIKKKKNDNKRTKGPTKRNKPNLQATPMKKAPVIDARYKLLSKRQHQPVKQITDARERLLQIGVKRDARAKIEQLKKMKQVIEPQERQIFQNHRKLVRTIQNKQRVFTDPSREVSRGAKITLRRQINTKRTMDRRLMEDKYMENYSSIKPIIRTVKNDNIELIDDDDDDPMGQEEYLPSKPSISNRRTSLQLKIIAQNFEARNKRSAALQRTILTEREKSPTRPPSILKKRPMAAFRSENTNERTEKPVLEYRIIVSNLRNSVTGADIEELFGDVGGMVESRLVRPGTAEVIYKTHEDAQKAVDLYHNRQLDGQPMTCLLVTPRSNAPISSRNGNKPPLYSTNSNVEPEVSTIHKVLFSSF